MEAARRTLQERLALRRIGSPPALVYLVLGYLWKAMFLRRLNVRYDFRIDPRKYRKGPFILVSNHASRLDYIYTGVAFLPQRLNYVAGYNEFFRSHLAFVFRLLQVIPKRNFVPDVYALKQISRVLRSGGKVALFPEGMSSIGGSNQPCAEGSGALLKHFKVPVLMTRIRGGYLTSTKYCLDERPGSVDVTVDLLFEPGDLESLSEAEIQDRLDRALRQDDYAWNKAERRRYAGKGRMARNLHQLLYLCPRCGAEFAMKGEGDEIRCAACGNGARLDERYDLAPLDGSCVVPETPRAWWDLQRRRVYREVLDPAFRLRERVRLGVLPKFEYLNGLKTSEIQGEGELFLDRGGLRYEGTMSGGPYSFRLNPFQVPTFGMCTDVSRFYTFHRGEFREFFPERESVAKWLLAAEEIHRLCGGPWRNFPDADTYSEN